MELNLKKAEQIRTDLSSKQMKTIRNMYKSLAKKAQKAAEELKDKENISSVLRQRYLKDLANELIEASNKIGTDIESLIKSSMKEAALGVVTCQQDFIVKLGLDIKGAFLHVPDEIVQAIITGQVYDGDWALSQAIWGNSEKIASDINKIIAEGVAANKGSYEIAKDLEQYVDPSKTKPWDWGKVYPGTNKVVDYNAQRLARTLVSHAYQQALVNSCAKNPFVTGFKWISGHTHRTCEICNARDGQIYPKDQLPLDHPNGLCTFGAVILDSNEEITDRLAAWVRGGSDPALDDWAASMSKRV